MKSTLSKPSGGSSEIKVVELDFFCCFETFSECSLPGAVSKNTVKKIGHSARKIDMVRQSDVNIACTSTNHARYLYNHLFELHFADRWMQGLVK